MSADHSDVISKETCHPLGLLLGIKIVALAEIAFSSLGCWCPGADCRSDTKLPYEIGSIFTVPSGLDVYAWSHVPFWGWVCPGEGGVYVQEGLVSPG